MPVPQSARRTAQLRTVTGEALLAWLPALAALRIAVFREWPYLYDGDETYERKYLARYAGTAGAAVVLALDGERCVGASTCLPLAAEGANIRAPFEAARWPVGRVCYFGESVLLPEYRGQGIGVGFFTAREAHAAALRLDICAFCAVVRPEDHPLKPEGYLPLDSFWRRRGYAPRPELVCTMRWQDLDQPLETEKRLGFWAKSLSGAPLPSAAPP
jgi:GNAT superfamily N-acetyltransferase